MKINDKVLSSIKNVEELKNIDSINNILEVINNEIAPLSVMAQRI